MTEKDRGHKTFEENKQACRKIRERGTAVIEELHQINETLETERLLKKLPVDIEITKKVIRETRRGFAELLSQLEAKTDYKKKLEKDLSKVEKERISRKSGVYQLEIKIGRNKAKISEIEDLESNMPQLEAERGRVNSRTKTLEQEIPVLLDETASMQSKVKAGTGELQKLEPENQRLKQSIYALEGRIAGYGDLEEKKEYLAVALGEKGQLSEKIRRLRIEINPGGQSKSEIEADAGKLEGEIKDIAGVLDDLKSKEESLSKAVIPKEEIDNLQTRLNSVERERDDLKARNEHAQKEIEGHLKEKGGLISEVEAARPELETMRNDFNGFRDKIELYEKRPEQLESLKNRMPELEREAEGHSRSAEKAREELKHLNNAVDIMNTELQTYKQAMQQIHSLLNI